MSSRTGRILVVDDDAALLKLMKSYLSRLGYRVDAYDNAEEAWALVQADPSLYSLALLDLKMPGLGGRALAQRIRESAPSIRLVVVSGYPGEQGGVSGEGVIFLQKPFTPAALVEAIANNRSEAK